LSPRQSFDTWREEVRGSSAPWDEADRKGAEAFAASLLHIRVSAQLARLNRELGTALQNERAALEEIRLLQSNLMQVGRRSAMATMASTLAHEVNQPLLALSNYVGAARHLLANPGSTDLRPVGDALEAAGESIQSVAGIVRNMRRSLDAQPIALVETDFSQAVKQALTLALSNEPASGGVQHDLDLQEDLLVEADAVQIQQVVLSLVANALEAMAETPRRALSISTFRQEGEACLRVSDSGSGLSEDARARLFEAFYTTKRGHLGTGLAVCRTMVEAHGGRIWTEDEAEGSTFLIALPLA
jgi:two-component system sensor kinase FixL